MNRNLCVAALGLGLLLPASFASAQEREGRGGPGGDFAQFRERMMNDLKDRLGANDEEWQVLKPKIEKVQTAQMAAATSRFGGMFGGRGGRDGGGDRGGDRNRGGGDSNRQRSAAEQASRDLRELLENKDAPADQVAEKLKALREARAKAKSELETAQKELQEVLTPRQEAVLVSSGTLE